jgi:hypothetical protein
MRGDFASAIRKHLQLEIVVPFFCGKGVRYAPRVSGREDRLMCRLDAVSKEPIKKQTKKLLF